MLAQVNIGRLVAPLDSPQIAGFVAALPERGRCRADVIEDLDALFAAER